jgi:formylglycine-generating enzyme required for sulfatase activity
MQRIFRTPQGLCFERHMAQFSGAIDYQVRRGGSWNNNHNRSRSAKRCGRTSTSRNNNNGFRSQRSSNAHGLFFGRG